MLVLAGVTLASPFAGLGTALGAIFGTVAGRFIPAYAREEWAWGLAGFNPAIIGLLSAGFLASGEIGPSVLIFALASSVFLDVALRRLLGRFMLPSLSAAALVTVYLFSLVLAPPGGWFWTDAAASPLMPFGLLGAVCIVAAMVARSPFAGAWALLLSAVAGLACWLSGHDPRAWMGLWGITVPLASYGVHAIFLRGSLAGCVAGSIAALLGALIWIAWEVSILGHWLPPLLAPFILGVWSSIVVMRRLMKVPLAQPALWRIARAIAAARGHNAEVVALIQGGTGPAAARSSFVSGAWLDPQMPLSAFERERLYMSPRCRQAFWDAVDRLRTEAGGLSAGNSLAAFDPLAAGGMG